MDNHQTENGTANPKHHRRRRRAEVLDSSGDESDSDSGHNGNNNSNSILRRARGWNGDAVISRSSTGSSATIGAVSQFSKSSTSIVNNLSSSYTSFSASLPPLVAKNGRGLGLLHDDKSDGGADEVEEEEDDADDDDALMNPYVMNPFPGRNGGNVLVLDCAEALLPPSMEMELASLSGKVHSGDSLQQCAAGRDSGKDDPGKQECGSASPSRSFSKAAVTDLFDPYSNLPEEEDIIEFLADHEQSGDEDHGGLNALGPLLSLPPPQPQGQSSFPSAAFSPFPAHRGTGDHEESSPLTAPRRRRARSGGVVSAVWDLLSSAVRALGARQLHRSGPPNANPFADPRRTVGRASAPRRRRWGRLARLRLLAAVAAAVFYAGTLAVTRQIPSWDSTRAGTDYHAAAGSATLRQGAPAEQEVAVVSRRPSSIVKRKVRGVQEGVRGFRRRGRHHRGREKGAAPRGAAAGIETEVYRHGKRQTTTQPPSVAAAANAPALAQAEENGMLLIKLPPPRSNALAPGGLGDDGDGTVYIRLPYPQPPQSSQGRRTLSEAAARQELTPPLLGAAVRPLAHHAPPPLEALPGPAAAVRGSRKGGSHAYRGGPDEEISAWKALRDEFEAWMAKHKKEYGTNDETERRFHVWRKNHLR